MSESENNNLYVSLDLPLDLYKAMEEKLSTKSVGDAFKDPFVMVCFHVFVSAQKDNPSIRIADPLKAPRE